MPVDVVVHRLRDRDERHAALVQGRRERQGVVAADRHQVVEPQRARCCPGRRGVRSYTPRRLPVGDGRPGRARRGRAAGPHLARVRARRVEHRAAGPVDRPGVDPVERPDVLRVELGPGSLVGQALPAAADAEDLVAELGRAVDDALDDRVEAGDVAAAGEDADPSRCSHGGSDAGIRPGPAGSRWIPGACGPNAHAPVRTRVAQSYRGPVVMIRRMNYELFMGEAIAEARQAARAGSAPIGAVAVLDDAMVARDHDRVDGVERPHRARRPRYAPRGRRASSGTRGSPTSTIFTTHEPCAMCVGALLETRRRGARLRRSRTRSRRRRQRLQLARTRARRTSSRSSRASARPRPAALDASGRRLSRRSAVAGADRDPLVSSARGEVSEWLMVPLSKSGVRKHRGFESHPLRHSDLRTTRRDRRRVVSFRGEVA